MILPFIAASLFAYGNNGMNSSIHESLSTPRMGNHLPEDIVLEIISHIDNHHDLLSYSNVNQDIRAILATLISFKRICFLENSELWPVLLLRPFFVYKFPNCADYIKANVVKYFSKVEIYSQPADSAQDSVKHTNYLLELLPSEIELKVYLSNHASSSIRKILYGETRNIVHLIIYKSAWDIRVSSMIGILLRNPKNKIRQLQINRPRISSSEIDRSAFNPIFDELERSKLTSFSIHCDFRNQLLLDGNSVYNFRRKVC
jgi:hypothetical protein